MAGEELPPVVAVLEGEDSSFLAMLERDIQAARGFAADLQAALEEGIGGLTFSGAQVSAEGMGAAGEVIGEQLATGIEEGAAGLNLGADAERWLGDATEAGVQAGEQLSGGLLEGVAGAGDAAGAAVAAGFDEGVSGIGISAVERLGEQFSQLAPDVAHQASAAFMQAFADGMSSTMSTIAVGSGVVGRLAATLSDGASEAGAAAGDSLIAALGDAAAQSAPAAAARAAAGLEASLTDTMTQAGADAGSVAGAGFAATFSASAREGITEANIAGILAEQFQAATGAAAEAAAAADMFVPDPNQAGRMTRLGKLTPEQQAAAISEAEQVGQQVGEAFEAGVVQGASSGAEAATAALSDAETAAYSDLQAQVGRVAEFIPEQFHSGIQVIGDSVAIVGADMEGLSAQALEQLGQIGQAAHETAAEAEAALRSVDFSAAPAGMATTNAFGLPMEEEAAAAQETFVEGWRRTFAEINDIVAGPQIVAGARAMGAGIAQTAADWGARTADYWSETFAQVADIVGLPQALEAASALGQGIASSARGAASAVGDAWSTGMDAVLGVFQSVGSGIAGAAGATAAAVQDAFGGALDWVRDKMADSGILDAWDELLAESLVRGEEWRLGIQSTFSMLGSDIAAPFQSAAAGIGSLFSNSGQIDAAAAAAGSGAGDAFSEALSARARSTIGMDLIGGGMLADMNTSSIGVPFPAAAVAGEAKAAAAATDEMAGAADGAKSAMGGLAQMMNGPVMNGLMGVSMVAMLPSMIGQAAPLLGQMFSNASISVTDFTQAVSQDSNAVGDNTAATIQNVLAKTDLNSMAQVLGVSQATLIEYAAGEAKAQNEVAAAYQRVSAYQQQNTSNSLPGLQAQKAQLDQIAGAVAAAIDQQRTQTDTLTAAEQTTEIYNATVGNLTASMRQQAQQAKMNADAQLQFIAGLVPGTEAYTDAVYTQNAALQANALNQKIAADAEREYLQNLEPYTAAFRDAVSTAQASTLASASSAGIAAVAALNLDQSQTKLIGDLYGSVDAYQRATSGATGYKDVLTAFNGTQMGIDQAQNTLAQDMLNAKTSFEQNAYSLDLNTQAGINNRQSLVNVSQAILGMGEAQYQATGNMDQANQTIQQEIDAYGKATGATGHAKDAIVGYLEQITKIPPDVGTTVHLDTANAFGQLATLLETIDTSSGVIHVYANTETGSIINSGMSGQARAAGGPVTAGQLYTVGESGKPEWFVPGADGYITPMDMLQPSGVSGAAGGSGGFGYGGAPVVNVSVYLDGELMTRGVRSESRYVLARNSTTGF